MNKITIIIPVYNNFTTIQEVFDSLEKQNHKELIEEIIIIDDNSNDNTRNLIEKYQNESSFKTKLIIHTKSNGLAANYNEGIELSKTDYFILMHADIVLIGYNSFSKMLEPLLKNEDVIASYPIILHPYSVWKDYNFWQKCLFSRFVGKRLKMITGKFDCFNKKLLLNRIGLFNETTYRTAGEDSDIKIRINKIGKLKVFSSGIEIIHLHNKDFNFSLKKLIKKEAQLAEAQGAVLRKYGILNTKGFILSFFREIPF
ncbi:glycosyltransferase [Patescibacteria group bacterium]|nr:glycosyltransferase [Patescibacteria group bacterium]